MIVPFDCLEQNLISYVMFGWGEKEEDEKWGEENLGNAKCNFPLSGWSEKGEEKKMVDVIFHPGSQAHHFSPFQIGNKIGEKMVMKRKVQNYS